jgi:hypothetical protein
MSKLNLRKTAYSVEEIFHEGGPAPANPVASSRRFGDYRKPLRRAV